MLPKILIVDDEINMCRSLEIILSEELDCEVEYCLSGNEAINKLKKKFFDVVVTDLAMPEMNGLELLKEIKKISPETQVIIMTAYSTVQSAIESMKRGAFEYLIKPFNEESLILTIKNALEYTTRSREAYYLKTQLKGKDRYGEIIGISSSMQEVYYRIEKAAQSDATVLITGESGTGKELVAKAIHFRSKRKDGPFIAVNCAAIPETLLESELFGYEKGAFTGAFRTRIGRIEAASGGTLFLDEIGDMPLSIQTKLLRVLEDKTIMRLGGEEPIKVDIRVVAATNKNLEELIKEQKFRNDLYFRLKVIHIVLPPLRERKEDIPLLVKYLIEKKREELGIDNPVEIDEKAMNKLIEYDYPGNVRELENIIQQALVLCEGRIIKEDDLHLDFRLDELNIDTIKIPVEGGWRHLQHLIKKLEKRLISEAIAKYGSRSNEEIASILGTSRRVLELRMQEYGIKKKR